MEPIANRYVTATIVITKGDALANVILDMEGNITSVKVYTCNYFPLKETETVSEYSQDVSDYGRLLRSIHTTPQSPCVAARHTHEILLHCGVA